MNIKDQGGVFVVFFWYPEFIYSASGLKECCVSKGGVKAGDKEIGLYGLKDS